MMSMGRMMMAAARARSLSLDRRKFCMLITKASSSEVDILEISAGWKRTGPRSNHEWEPLTSLDTKITTTSSPSTRM